MILIELMAVISGYLPFMTAALLLTEWFTGTLDQQIFMVIAITISGYILLEANRRYTKHFGLYVV